MTTRNSQTLTWIGIALIMIMGLIHLIDAPDSFNDATYKGVLFVLNGIGALVAAVSIYRGVKSWGWGFGLLLAGGAFVAYALSRTVGLPGLEAEPDKWFELFGITSFLVEGVFVLVALRVLLRRPGRLNTQASIPDLL